MEAQKNAATWVRLNKEQRKQVSAEMVENLIQQYIIPEGREAFCRRHKAEFRNIADGNVSKALVLYAKKSNRAYKARIKGLLVNSTPEGERYTFDFIFGQTELQIPDQISIKGGKDTLHLSEVQIETLKNTGVLDELLVSEKGATYYAAVDTDLKRLAIADSKFVHTPKTLHGVALSDEQSAALASGRAIEYDRENPNNKQELLVFSARYNPIYYTIRSEQVLDHDGRAVVRQASQEKISISEPLKSVEDTLREADQKFKKQSAQKQQR